MSLSMPTSPGFVSSNFWIAANTQIFESPLSRAVQRNVLSGSFWMASYTLPIMNRDTAAEWDAFFSDLEGRKNTFNAFDPIGVNPRGIATGTPLVNGSSQTGDTLLTDGWTASQVGIMKKGDYFSIGNELYKMTQDVDSDGGGNATLEFKPQIRTSPSDNAPLVVSSTTVPMIAIDNSISNLGTDRRNLYIPKSFIAMEAIGI